MYYTWVNNELVSLNLYTLDSTKFPSSGGDRACSLTQDTTYPYETGYYSGSSKIYCAGVWHTVWSGSKLVGGRIVNGTVTATSSISGLVYNIPTRISGNYTLHSDDTQVGSGTYNATSINQTSASYTNVVERTFASTKKYQLYFNVNSAGKLGYQAVASGLVGDGTDGALNYITKIEQYY